MRQKKLHTISGVLLPFRYNSDGKVIQFKIQPAKGAFKIIQADKLIKKLRKLCYKDILIVGEKRQGKFYEYLLPKELINLDHSDVYISRDYDFAS